MQIEKLIARIRGQLEVGTPDLEARTLAGDYASLCIRARERLEQCATLIRSQNDYAAFQIAETEPDLLTLCSQLSFADSEHWHALCRERGLPAGFILDEQHLLAVEGLYGKSIGENHPLYREYREAMRTRDEPRALNVLRSIARINPEDPTAHSELARLSAKFLREAFVTLNKLFANQNWDEALSLMDQMERLGTNDLVSEPQWIDALARRLNFLKQKAALLVPTLIEAAQTARTHDAWEDCAQSLGQIRNLERDHEIIFTESTQEILIHLENWAGELAAVAEAEASRRSSTQQLIAEWENLAKEVQGDRSHVELLAELNQWLDRANQQEEHLPTGIIREVQSAAQTVRSRLSRRYAFLMSLWIGSFLLLVGAGFYWQRTQELQAEARGHFQEVKALVESWDTEKASQKLEGIKKSKLLGHQTSEYLNEQTNLLQEIHSQREVIVSLRTEADYLQSSLQSGINGTNYAVITNHAKGYIQAISKIGSSAVAELNRICPDPTLILSTCNKIAQESQLQLLSLRGQLKKSLGNQDKIVDLTASIATIEKLRTLVENLSIAGVKDLDEVNSEIDRANTRIENDKTNFAYLQKLTAATDLKLYFNALGEISKKSPESSELNKEAKNILTRSENILKLPRSVLAPHMGLMWDNIPNADSSGIFQPSQLTPFESTLLQSLADTRTLLSLRRFYVRLNSSQGQQKLRSVIIVGEVNVQRNRIRDGIEYVLSAKELTRDGEIIDATWSRREFNNNNGEVIRSGEDLVEEASIPELDYLRQFSRLFEIRDGKLAEPLIRKLDLVRRSSAPFFELRAYQLQELFKAANQRPEAWGIIYSPSAQRDFDQLRRITQNSIQPFDFLFKDKWADVQTELKSILLRQGSCPYAEEARFWRSLFTNLRTQKMVFVGFQNNEGRSILRERITNTILFGIDREGKANVLYRVDQEGHLLSVNEPAPLSPLVRLSSSVTEAAQNAGVPTNLSPPEGGWEVILLGRDF